MKKAISVCIVCACHERSQWLGLSLKLSGLHISNIDCFHDVKQLEIGEYHNLVIVTDTEFSAFSRWLKLHHHGRLPFPLLVLTSEFNSFTVPKSISGSVDTLPLPIVTVNLLEHTVVSLRKDFHYASRLTKLAHYDPLTGAANRLLFEDRLSETIKRVRRFKEPLSLIYFDLDDFKPVNDTYGHDVGDVLLCRFVDIVKTQLRETDTLARMGGDEFALVLANTSRTSLQVIAQKVISSLAGSSIDMPHQIEIKASMGGVTVDSCTSEKITSQLLLKKADEAVYLAKKTEGTLIVYDQSLNLCSS